jgi:ATP-dependent RNA helicase SUPV3L1/SUV3
MRVSADEPRGITAILGPTNTGKTHQALERMLEHRTGMIGLPLRLLAREVYDRLTTKVGEREVALITGEEKRIPPSPRYFVCTVEAMPIDRQVDFLAIDEIQLCSHAERGHVFTDRMLRARGRLETWFMGSPTIRPLLERFVPTTRFSSRPRLSALRSAPPTSLSKLPARTAVVAFSTDRVYEVAAQLRQKRGGAAVVLGALSPRTRNAQVALYQSGEVDYLVATDAIGMGLNLSIDHVAFAGRSKFDGREQRPLEVAELAQIAGRAGRYLNPGTFGTLLPMADFAPRVIRALENHVFPTESQLLWRNTDLDFSSVRSLIDSLTRIPKRRGLKLMAGASDQRALMQLVHQPAVYDRLKQPESVELLWDICQIPDFRQLWFESHVKLLEQLFLQLSGTTAQIDPDFIAERLRRIDDIRGDIETLLGRIADIRTWTYVAAHPRWLADNSMLRDQSMAIEDRLSDALHERLVLQFVERTRTTSVGSKRTRQTQLAHAESPFAALLDLYTSKEKASNPTLTGELTEAIINGSHEQFQVDSQGSISHNGKRVAALEAGTDLLHPNVRLVLDFDPGPGTRSRLMRRLLAFSRDIAEALILPLRLRAAAQLTPAGRGFVYQLEQNLGTIWVEQSRDQLQMLTNRDRQLLTSFGVHVGKQLAYMRRTLTPIAITERAALAAAHYALQSTFKGIPLGATSIELGDRAPRSWLTCIGYAAIGSLGIRADHYEIVSGELARLARARNPEFPRHLALRLGCSAEQIATLMYHAGVPKLSLDRFARRARRHDSRINSDPTPDQSRTEEVNHSRAARRPSE